MQYICQIPWFSTFLLQGATISGDAQCTGMNACAVSSILMPCVALSVSDWITALFDYDIFYSQEGV